MNSVPFYKLSSFWREGSNWNWKFWTMEIKLRNKFIIAVSVAYLLAAGAVLCKGTIFLKQQTERRLPARRDIEEPTSEWSMQDPYHIDYHGPETHPDLPPKLPRKDPKSKTNPSWGRNQQPDQG